MRPPLAPALALLTAFALAAPVHAEDALTLDQALAAALSTHPALRVAEADAASAEAAVLTARVPFPENPELALALSDEGPFGTSGRSHSVTLTQAFWSPGQRSARMKAAEALVTAAGHSREWTRRLLAAETAEAFALLHAALARDLVATEVTGLLSRIADATEQWATAGRVSEFERNRARVETAAAVAELTEIRLGATEARENLRLLTGLALEPGTVLGPLPVTPTLADLEAFAAMDPLARPDVSAARAREVQADEQVIVERRERLPRFSLGVGVARDSSTLDGGDFRGFDFPTEGGSVRDEDRSALVELTVSLPVVNRNRGGIAQALAERTRAEAQRVGVERAAASELRLLLERARLFEESLRMLEGASGPLADNLAVLEQAHALGRMNLTDVLLERGRLLRAGLLLEQVRGARAAAGLRLAALAGALTTPATDGLEVGATR